MEDTWVWRPKRPGGGPVGEAPTGLAVTGPARGRKPHRAFLMGFSLVVLLYSLAVLLSVAWMGDIGLRCVFGIDVKEPVSPDYAWSDGPPQPRDEITSIAGTPVANYSDYIKGLGKLSRLVDRTVGVT